MTLTTTLGRAARTRSQLQDAALRLIGEQGYDATTVEQIAGAAGVSHMTFFRHFPTKDAVVLDDGFDPAIASAVAATPRDLPPVARVCAGLRGALANLDSPDQEQVRARVRVASGHAALRAGMWRNTEATQEAVAAVLVADGVATRDARIAAAAALAVVTVALQEWCLEESADPMPARLTSALDLLDPAGSSR